MTNTLQLRQDVYHEARCRVSAFNSGYKVGKGAYPPYSLLEDEARYYVNHYVVREVYDQLTRQDRHAIAVQVANAIHESNTGR